MGIKDPKRIYNTDELAPGKKIIFACSGVTDGNTPRCPLLWRRRAHISLIMTLDQRQVRFIDSVHLENRPDIKVRFN